MTVASAGVGVAATVGVRVAVAVGSGEGVGVTVGVSLGAGTALGVAVGSGIAVGVRVGSGISVAVDAVVLSTTSDWVGDGTVDVLTLPQPASRIKSVRIVRNIINDGYLAVLFISTSSSLGKKISQA